jgi:hypothetical protein
MDWIAKQLRVMGNISNVMSQSINKEMYRTSYKTYKIAMIAGFVSRRKKYLKHLSKLSAAEASCMASTAAICADSLYLRSSCHRINMVCQFKIQTRSNAIFHTIVQVKV